jgi:hypothetical protein
LTHAKEVLCWGNPVAGEDGTDAELTRPAPMTAMRGADAIHVGPQLVEARFADGHRVRCTFRPGGPQHLDESSPQTTCRRVR